MKVLCNIIVHEPATRLINQTVNDYLEKANSVGICKQIQMFDCMKAEMTITKDSVTYIMRKEFDGQYDSIIVEFKEGVLDTITFQTYTTGEVNHAYIKGFSIGREMIINDDNCGENPKAYEYVLGIKNEIIKK